MTGTTTATYNWYVVRTTCAKVAVGDIQLANSLADAKVTPF